MEDLPLFLASTVSTSQGQKKTMDTVTEASIERDIMKKGREGDTTGFFAIHAGYAGKDGAHFVHDHLRKKMAEEMSYDKDIKDALGKAMFDTQKDLYKHWKDTGYMQGCQSSVVVVRDSVVHCVNAGHCTALLCRAEGEFIVLSPEHCDKRFDEAEKFPIKSLALDFEDEFLLLATNNFWDKFSHEQAIRMTRTALRKYRDIQYAAQKLVYAGTVNGVPGNVAVIIVLLNANAACGGEPKNGGLFSKKSGSSQHSGDGMSAVSSHSNKSAQSSHSSGSGRSAGKGVLRVRNAPLILTPQHTHTTTVLK